MPIILYPATLAEQFQGNKVHPLDMMSNNWFLVLKGRDKYPMKNLESTVYQNTVGHSENIAKFP